MDLEDCLISEDEDLKVVDAAKKPFLHQLGPIKSLPGAKSMLEVIQPMRQTYGLYAHINTANNQAHSDSEGSLDEMLNPCSEQTPVLHEKVTFGMNRSSQVSTTAADSWPFGCSPGSSMSLARISPEDVASALDGQNSRFKISPKSVAIPESKTTMVTHSRMRLFQEDPSEESFLPRPSLLGKRDPFAQELRESVLTSTHQSTTRLSRSGSSSRSSSALTCLKSESDSSSSCAEDCVVLEEESTPLRPKSYKRSHYGNQDQKHKRKFKGKPDLKHRGPQVLLNRAILGNSKKKPKEKKEKETRVLIGIEDVLKTPHNPKIDEIVKAIRESNNKKVKKKMARILEKEYGIDGYCLLPREVLLELNKFSDGNLPNSIMINENGEKVPQDTSYANAKIECACEKGACKDKKCVCSKHGKRCGLDCRCRNCSNPSQTKRLRLDQTIITDLNQMIGKEQVALDLLMNPNPQPPGESQDLNEVEFQAKKQGICASIAAYKEQLRVVLDKNAETIRLEVNERFEREKQSVLNGESSDFITLPSLIEDQSYITQIKAKLKDELIEELRTKKLPPGSKHHSSSYSKKIDVSGSKQPLEGSRRAILGVESLCRSSDSQDGGSDSYGLGKLGRGKYTRTKLLKIHFTALVLEIENSPFTLKADCLQKGVKIATWKSISTMKGVRFKKLREADPKLVEMIAAEKKRKALLKKKEAKLVAFRESEGEYEYDDEEYEEELPAGPQKDSKEENQLNSTSSQVVKPIKEQETGTKPSRTSVQPVVPMIAETASSSLTQGVTQSAPAASQMPTSTTCTAAVGAGNGVGPNKKKKKYNYKTPRLKQPPTTPQPQKVPSVSVQPTQEAQQPLTPIAPLLAVDPQPPANTTTLTVAPVLN